MSIYEYLRIPSRILESHNPCMSNIIHWLSLSFSVSAGSQGVPEEIQKCHSLSRQLQNNQTLIFSQIESMAQRLLNFTILVSECKLNKFNEGGFQHLIGHLRLLVIHIFPRNYSRL